MRKLKREDQTIHHEPCNHLSLRLITFGKGKELEHKCTQLLRQPHIPSHKLNNLNPRELSLCCNEDILEWIEEVSVTGFDWNRLSEHTTKNATSSFGFCFRKVPVFMKNKQIFNILSLQIMIDQQQINILKSYPTETGFHLLFSLDRHGPCEEFLCLKSSWTSNKFLGELDKSQVKVKIWKSI